MASEAPSTERDGKQMGLVDTTAPTLDPTAAHAPEPHPGSVVFAPIAWMRIASTLHDLAPRSRRERNMRTDDGCWSRGLRLYNSQARAWLRKVMRWKPARSARSVSPPSGLL